MIQDVQVFSIAIITIVENKFPLSSIGFLFDLGTPQRVYSLVAESPQSIQKWFLAIQLVQDGGLVDIDKNTFKKQYSNYVSI
jgi:hypothetical protein